uniref:Uncharacterized protein n=2 Tax=Chenopodium quinoa TaxID=63459 RepID=A0A803NF62_CHEQI
MRRTFKTVQQYCVALQRTNVCEGLRCELDGDYPGSGGVCRPLKPCRRTYQLCGGINRLKCCQGLRCVLDDDYPEVGGVCMPGRKCQSDYESCGGSTGLQCCERYACVYDASSYAGDGGVCVPTYKQSSSSK